MSELKSLRIRPSSQELQYLHSIKYTNNLPIPPNGPYFLKHNANSGIYHKINEFSQYIPSTLEKSYIWQAHLENNGLDIDLVDIQDTLLYEKCELTSLDMKYLQYHKTNKALTSETSNPWWLRNTTYIEHNLFTSEKNKRVHESSINNINKMISENIFSLKATIDSFEQTKQTIEKLIVEKAKKNIQLEASYDILSNSMYENQILTSIRYPTGDDSLENMNSSIITNIRSLQSNKLENSTTVESSLVIPSNQHDNQDRYDWIKDYYMISQVTDKEHGLYFFAIPKENDKTNSFVDCISYQHFLLMQKIPDEDSQPCIVTRKRKIESLQVDRDDESKENVKEHAEDENDLENQKE